LMGSAAPPLRRARILQPDHSDRRMRASTPSHPGTHGLCAYLTNEASGQTWAHAGAWWTNG
jgi:hypothetical protein